MIRRSIYFLAMTVVIVLVILALVPNVIWWICSGRNLLSGIGDLDGWLSKKLNLK